MRVFLKRYKKFNLHGLKFKMGRVLNFYKKIIDKKLPYLWVYFGVFSITGICIVTIINIKFKNSINKILLDLLLDLCVGIAVSCFFYMINEYIPNTALRKLYNHHINTELNQIMEMIKQCAFSILPMFDFETVKMPSKKEYINKFCKANLYSKIFTGNKTIIDILEDNKIKIKELSLNLQTEYGKYLNSLQINYIRKILGSYFILNSIEPIDFNYPTPLEDNFPNNQKEIGESIYYLYSIRHLLKIK